MDRTLILVKPDAFERGLSGEIIARFERKGLAIVALRSMTVERELAERHYAEHAEKPFFGELVQFITSGPILAMVLEGTDAVKAARQLIGATNPLDAAPGSIRGDFAIEMGQNMVHGSDSGPLVLASSSPQRRAILERVGARFEVRPADIDEIEQGEPAEVAGENALLKARAARLHAGETVLGVDTL